MMLTRLSALALLATPALAGDVSIEVRGSISTNSYSSGPFAGPTSGPASVSFEVFVPGTDVTPGQATNYSIDLATFAIDLGAGPLAPTLAGATNCLIQNDNPGADGLRIFMTQLDTGHFFACELGASGAMWGSTDVTTLGGTYDYVSFISSFSFMVQGQGGFLEIFPEEIVIGGAGFEATCFGDGGDQAGCTPCPCGNEAAAPGTGGCLNSSGGSAMLEGLGTGSVGAADLAFRMLDANATTFAVLGSGDNLLPNSGPCPPGAGIVSMVAPLDGLRCVGGAFQRHGSRATDANGDVGVTNNGWGPPAGPPGGIADQGGFTAGQTRHFQAFYRELDTLVCTTGQNTSNAVTVLFVP